MNMAVIETKSHISLAREIKKRGNSRHPSIKSREDKKTKGEKENVNTTKTK